MIEADENKLKEALKRIGRLADECKALDMNMAVVKEFCAGALGSYDFSEAKPITPSEHRLDLLANGNPKVKEFLLNQALMLMCEVEAPNKPAGFVTYLAGVLGVIHETIKKMEWDREGSKKERERFLMKEALLRIVETTELSGMDGDEKYSAMASVVRSVIQRMTL